jgi:putative methionine-R-sulfoxide reductase with GAF domain
MLGGRRICDELHEMAAEPPDAILHRAVQRIHEHGDAYDWVGIYLLGGDQLILHSFIGKPTEHLRIPVGRGVCGAAVAEDRDINVPDVTAVEDYLTCSPETRSEIVVLIKHDDRIIGQIDIDSDTPAAFGENDERELRLIADALGELVGPSLR